MQRKSKPLARGWDRTFDDPIPLPDGRELVSLRDAGHYITNLPKAEHDAPEWHAAIEALMLVVEHGGDTVLPRIGIVRARCVAIAGQSRRRARGGQRNIGSSDDVHRLILAVR
jgi:hypothetical protein